MCAPWKRVLVITHSPNTLRHLASYCLGKYRWWDHACHTERPIHKLRSRVIVEELLFCFLACFEQRRAIHKAKEALTHRKVKDIVERDYSKKVVNDGEGNTSSLCSLFKERHELVIGKSAVNQGQVAPEEKISTVRGDEVDARRGEVSDNIDNKEKEDNQDPLPRHVASLIFPHRRSFSSPAQIWIKFKFEGKISMASRERVNACSKCRRESQLPR